MHPSQRYNAGWGSLSHERSTTMPQTYAHNTPPMPPKKARVSPLAYLKRTITDYEEEFGNDAEIYHAGAVAALQQMLIDVYGIHTTQTCKFMTQAHVDNPPPAKWMRDRPGAQKELARLDELLKK